MTHFNAQVTMQRVSVKTVPESTPYSRNSPPPYPGKEVVEIFKINLVAETLDELKELVVGHTALVRDNAGIDTRTLRGADVPR